MATVYDTVTSHVAELAGKSAVMDQWADRILSLAKAKARAHKLTGNYIDNLKVVTTGNGKDRLVIAEDVAAIPIEFGHMQVVKRGRRVSAVWVPGQRVMRDTYAAITGD